MPPLTRGSLPSSVYWRRRLVLLTVALVLVVAIAKLLDHGSDASSATPDPGAEGVAALTSPSDSGSSSLTTVPHRRHTLSVPTTSAPAVPEGTCSSADVAVVPRVDQAVVGTPVTISLDLHTVTTPACYWTVGPRTVQVSVSSGGETVWSTVTCRIAVPQRRVVVRSDATTSVPIVWAGHRADNTCSVHSPWAGIGRYTATAVALGGEPSSADFEMLKTAPAPTITVTPTPTPTGTASSSASGTPTGSAGPHRTAKASRSAD